MSLKKPRTTPRILPLLSVLFVSGAALRIALGMDMAVASSGSPENLQMPIPDAATNAPYPVQPGELVAQADLGAEQLLELNRRERELARRQEELAEQEARLEQARLGLQTQLTELQTAEADLSATMALADRAAEEDISRLVTVFEAMAPEEAAAVFTEMDTEFAAGFISQLAPATAAEILAGLEPRHAYALSAIIAGRNASVPTR